jgi:hypothetical protein
MKKNKRTVKAWLTVWDGHVQCGSNGIPKPFRTKQGAIGKELGVHIIEGKPATAIPCTITYEL